MIYKKDVGVLSKDEQIKYWKESFDLTYEMLDKMSEVYMEQLDFHRGIILELRNKLHEARRANSQ
jgi:hypothetical protein